MLKMMSDQLLYEIYAFIKRIQVGVYTIYNKFFDSCGKMFTNRNMKIMQI